MKSESLVFVFIVLIIVAILGGIVYLSTQAKLESSVEQQHTEDTNMSQQTNQQSAFPELIKEDTVVGTGAVAEKGKVLEVNYTGKLLDGTVFDSSLNPGRSPFEFQLGAGDVIQGWDEGFEGMKVGGKRTLKIPSHLAYGNRAAGELIKPNSDLIFEVELLDVR